MKTDILNDLKLTEKEEDFVKESKSDFTAEINQSKIISILYLIKKLENITDRTIESNKKLSD